MRWLAALLIALCGLAACYEQSNLEQQPQPLHFDHTVFLNDQPFKVAIFDTPAEREKGLMWVETLAEYHGALFIFEQEATVSFWMKNTRMPLDLLFFNSQGELIKALSSVQPCSLQDCPIVTVEKTKLALELLAHSSHQQLLNTSQRLYLKIQDEAFKND